MTRLLITESDGNILRASNFLRNSEELQDIYTLIINNKRVADDITITSEQRHKIQVRLNEWIRISLGEWRIDYTRSPHELTQDDRKKESFRCEFCGKKLSAILYYVVNQENEKIITVGSECVKKLENPEFMGSAHFNKTAGELNRYERLVKSHPEADMVIRNGSKWAEERQFVIPRRLSNRFTMAYKNSKRAISRYTHTGSYTGKAAELSQWLAKYRKSQKRINEFESMANVHPEFYLSRDTIRNEERLDLQNTKEIISAVMNDGGILQTNVASQIQNFSYLRLVAKVYSENPELGMFHIMANDNGSFYLTFELGENRYGFYSPSATIIENLGFPELNKNIPTVKELTHNIGNLLSPDSDTIVLLSSIAEKLVRA
ncbi:hypothetical protein RIN67_02515 [Levilactobacillus namurensis]|uniref:hypothetical protein n=1 Tax=Levilactobacillus namurensis TaxID=380393 RepID=UPI0028B41ABF|nr:hypothetical protein [Levilactobacillus namurensis]MDT7019419.1 hypothetical protein [Levilactobacillus namurensis]WNN65985.1 hypothetical protein RIN67_02515 [Levilactobacillus namurensis]